jgi:hypothetical protein
MDLAGSSSAHILTYQPSYCHEHCTWRGGCRAYNVARERPNSPLTPAANLFTQSKHIQNKKKITAIFSLGSPRTKPKPTVSRRHDFFYHDQHCSHRRVATPHETSHRPSRGKYFHPMGLQCTTTKNHQNPKFCQRKPFLRTLPTKFAIPLTFLNPRPTKRSLLYQGKPGPETS